MIGDCCRKKREEGPQRHLCPAQSAAEVYSKALIFSKSFMGKTSYFSILMALEMQPRAPRTSHTLFKIHGGAVQWEPICFATSFLVSFLSYSLS